jgi:hypothetical protein
MSDQVSGAGPSEAESEMASEAPSASRTRWQTLDKRLHDWGVVLLMLSVVVVAVGYLVSPHVFDRSLFGDEVAGGAWLRFFAVFALSFFPGWLLVRFLGLRGPALWSEYVLNLHRLGVDRRECLPAPPVISEFRARWECQRHAHDLSLQADPDNLYLQKFESSFGAVDTPEEGSSRATLSRDTAFPVVLVTATFAAGWSAILASPSLYSQPPMSLARLLAVAFAGSYLFIAQMLIRRYFQNDLKSSAYVSAFARLVTVLITVTVLYEVTYTRTGTWTEPVIIASAFVVGFFPMAGLVFLRNTSARLLGSRVGSLRSQYPLSELDGLNLWYETRLLEEGIEDMSELVNANVVDVLLHTRVPAGRLVDWLDQAQLFLHLPPLGSGDQRGTEDPSHIRQVLRRAGIVNATSLLTAFGEYNPAEQGGSKSWRPGRSNQPATIVAPRNGTGTEPSEVAELTAWIDGQCSKATKVRLGSIVRILRNHTALTSVLNWRQCGASRLRELEAGLGDTDEDPAHPFGVVAVSGA